VAPPLNRARRSPEASTLLSVYSGRECIGHVVARGREGFEAFTADEISIGMFETKRDAIDVLMKVEPAP
jgi:hypothetical protein